MPRIDEMMGIFIPDEISYQDEKSGSRGEKVKNTVPAVIGENIIVPIPNERKSLQWKLIAKDTDSVIYLNTGENIIQRCQLEPCTREEAFTEYIKIICGDEKEYLIIEPLVDDLLLSHIIAKGEKYSVFIPEMNLVVSKGNVEVKRVQNKGTETEGMTLQFFSKEKETELQWICEVGENSKITTEEYILLGKRSNKYWKVVSYLEEELRTEAIDIAGVADDECGWGEEW